MSIDDSANDSNGEAELALAKKTLEGFLTALGVPNTVTGKIEEEQIHLTVDSEDGGTLIGRKGQTLNSLQHLINSTVRSHKFRIFVDIGDYRQRSIERLEDIAHKVAQQALQTRRRVELKPMTAAERRIIHLTIQTYGELSTESVGEDPYRRIVIIPAGAPPVSQVDHRGSMRGPARDSRDSRDSRPPRTGGGQRIPRRDAPRPAAGGERRYNDAPPAPRFNEGPLAPRPMEQPRRSDAPAARGNQDNRGPRPGGTGGGGVDRWGYTRDIPAEAREWMADERVTPISGNNSWEAIDEPAPQPWVKDQPVFKPTASPWVDVDDVDYKDPAGGSDRW
jgi:predicted RNA-binding protein Jag